MKSPFTGRAMTLQNEQRTMNFRKETFEVMFQYYLCDETGEQFTDEQLDEVNTNQVYNQYRSKYGIPFPDEIKAIREQYGLSANKMAEILGLGINVYRNYESGEMPSVSNGRLIQMVKDPREFKRLIDYSKNEFTSEELDKINRKIAHALNGWSEVDNLYEEMMLGARRPGPFNGYRIPNFQKIGQMVLYFSEKMQPYKTKLNKLLFYADFFHYKMTCFSISGLTYQAIQNGPVPKHYDLIFDNIVQKKIVHIKIHDYGNYIGEQFLATGSVKFDKDTFTESELKAMQAVTSYFEKLSLKVVVDKSHEEYAWKENIEEYNDVNYMYGFYLKYPIIANND